MIARRLVFPRFLEVNDDAILFPHGFPRTRNTRISYADIIWLRDGAVASNPSFCLMTCKGVFEIGAARFSDVESYRTVKDFIHDRASLAGPSKDELAKILAAFPDPIVAPADWPRYRTHLVTSKPLLPRLAKALWFFIRCLGIIYLPWLLLHLSGIPTVSFAGFIGLSISAATFFTCVYWLYKTHPARYSKITIRPNGITELHGKQTWNWSYRDFSGWAMVERLFEGRILYILLLKRPKHVVTFVLPDAGTRDRFVQLLRDKNIPHLPELQPPWE